MAKAAKMRRGVLAGNPNCGKSSLFNRLTGDSQYVGNWPGVTVEKKTGVLQLKEETMELLDLPGVYSLSPYSPEERIAKETLESAETDLIINVVDADNPERNLYLTVQLLELSRPMIVVFNMLDVLEKKGDRLDCKKFEQMTGVCAVPVSAAKGMGLNTFSEMAFAAGKRNKQEIRYKKLYPPVGADCADPEGVLAQRRYDAAEMLARACVRRAPRPAQSLSDRIDRIATHRAGAIPLFLLIVGLIFTITFGPPGSFLTGLVESALEMAKDMVHTLLTAWGASGWAQSLLLDGVFSGVGAVLQFLPQILLLFSLLSILEDSGYMARAAFIMDAPMRRLGLSGRSFVPLLMGFGCTVPAVMGTRILEQEKDKRLTILILPFMSCSAKMPVYALFLGAFFAGREPVILLLLYACGVGMAVLSALLFKNTILKGRSSAFVMELPPYRMPSFQNVWTRVRERLVDFLRRAGTVLLCASLLVWILRSFTPALQYTENSAQSILAALGGFLAPAFTLCGFADWKPAVALLTGLVAKESVVGTMGVLYGGNLTEAVQNTFTPLSSLSFLLFVLLYTPCAAALSAVRREMGNLKWTLVTVFWQFAAAWYVSALFFQIALLAEHLIKRF